MGYPLGRGAYRLGVYGVNREQEARQERRQQVALLRASPLLAHTRRPREYGCRDRHEKCSDHRMQQHVHHVEARGRWAEQRPVRTERCDCQRPVRPGNLGAAAEISVLWVSEIEHG
eukprot:4016806-Pyramimonas_sp.AAC.1